jgi:tetratricopeptide (TPR) repeat protein
MFSFIFLGIQVSGCATLSDSEQSRKIQPTFSEGMSKWKFEYDPDVRGYRIKSVSLNNQKSPLEGKVLRNEFGKKIQTQKELSLFLNATESPGLEKYKVGRGVVLGVAIVVGTVLLPIVVAQGVINLPMQPVISNIDSQHRNNAENAYKSGRDNYYSGNTEKALADWEKAEVLIPAIKGLSDIDYFRGRAYEMRHQFKEALMAYEEFLRYSESSIPSFFNSKYSNEVSWKLRAEDADSRIVQILKQMSSLEKERDSFLKEGQSIHAGTFSTVD